MNNTIVSFMIREMNLNEEDKMTQNEINHIEMMIMAEDDGLSNLINKDNKLTNPEESVYTPIAFHSKEGWCSIQCYDDLYYVTVPGIVNEDIMVEDPNLALKIVSHYEPV